MVVMLDGLCGRGHGERPRVVVLAVAFLDEDEAPVATVYAG